MASEKPTILESQQHINDENGRLAELQDLHVNGEISRGRYEDEEQLVMLRRQRAEREREEAVDRQTGRKVTLRKRIGRAATKFLIG